MTTEEMLEAMFGHGLGRADMKAIGKSRGFSREETSSPELMRHIFLTDTGVRKALASLGRDEILVLHLLSCLGRPVDVAFFERLYTADRSPDVYYGSFNERYGGVFKQVKSRLVRCGVVLFAEQRGYYIEKTTSKLERLRFLFPQQLEPCLPPPLAATRLDAPASRVLRRDVLRPKLLEIIGRGPKAERDTKDKKSRLHVEDGNLLLGRDPFSIKRLEQWKAGAWEKAVRFGKKTAMKPDDWELSPAKLASYALSHLKDNEWAAPDALPELWKAAHPEIKLPGPSSVCEAGWEAGCLEKLERNGAAFYRPAGRSGGETAGDKTAGPGPGEYLDAATGEAVEIDLRRVPADVLELLAGVSILSVRDGVLTASPDLVRISHAPERMLHHSVFTWLKKHHRGFGSVVRDIDARKGKTIIHENLVTARIKNLSLKLMIEKKFSGPGRVVSLSDEFIAFPVGLAPDVRKLVKRAGHVVGTVSADDIDQD